MPIAMKLLVLCKRVPYPLTDGESLRIFNYAKRLAGLHRLDLVCLQDPSRSADVDGVFGRIEALPAAAREEPSAIRRMSSVFRVEAFMPRFPVVEQHLSAVLPERGYDVIWSSADMITSIPASCRVPVLADICDDDVLMLRRELGRVRGAIPFLRVLKRLLIARQYERRFYAAAQACMFVSEIDGESFRKLAPEARVIVIPNGVDAEHFAPSARVVAPATIVFEGSMDFPPNADAAVHLCRDILPHIVARRPDVRVVVVGRDPKPEVLALADERVRVTGFVDDVRPYLAEATVFVCPLRKGAGIKNKVLQAWSMSKAVVATPMSVGGLDVREGENILVRDDPSAFAAAVVDLLNDGNIRTRLGNSARSTVLQSYTWEAKTRELETLLLSIVSARRGPRSERHA